MLPREWLEGEEERRRWFACSMDIVKENLSAFDFIEYKKGWIPERFADVADQRFAFVRIDADHDQALMTEAALRRRAGGAATGIMAPLRRWRPDIGWNSYENQRIPYGETIR